MTRSRPLAFTLTNTPWQPEAKATVESSRASGSLGSLLTWTPSFGRLCWPPAFHHHRHLVPVGTQGVPSTGSTVPSPRGGSRGAPPVSPRGRVKPRLTPSWTVSRSPSWPLVPGPRPSCVVWLVWALRVDSPGGDKPISFPRGPPLTARPPSEGRQRLKIPFSPRGHQPGKQASRSPPPAAQSCSPA